MASIPGVRLDITGASGSQGLLGPKESWQVYIFPRGAHASQDSTGTTITFDSANAASRFTANDWVQVGLSTANIRQVSAVGGNSITVSSAVTVSENDRIYLVGSTQPSVSGGSATYTTPNTKIRKRDDDAADLYTNSMITSDSNGVVQFWTTPESGPGVGSVYFDAMIQDGNQANQGSIIDLEVGTGDARESWTITAYPVGAVVASASITTTITVDAGHSFKANDKFIVGTSETTMRTVSSVTATSLVYSGSTISVAVADLLTNLGPDTGSSTPNYDASSMVIYSDADRSTAITNSQVSVNSDGRAIFWHKGDGAFWQLALNRDGVAKEVIPGHRVGERFNIADYGAAIDGSTDDSGAVQATQLGVETLGGVVIHPGGTCLLDNATLASITLNAATKYQGVPGVSIFKAGSSGNFSGGAGTMFVVAADDCSFEGIDIDCDYSNVGLSHAIEVTGARKNLKVRDCRLFGASIYGIRAQNAANTITGLWVEGCEFTDCKWGVNIVSSASSDMWVQNCKFGYSSRGNDDVRSAVAFDRDCFNGHVIGCTMTGGRFGVALASCTDVVVAYNRISGQNETTTAPQGVHIESTAGEAVCRRIKVHGNFIEGCSNIGIAITGVSGPTNDIQITSNTIRGCSNGGILMDDASNFIISGNVIHTNDGSGIAVTSTSGFTNHGKVSDNIIYNNQVRALGNGNISIGTDLSNVLVCDNQCYDDQGSATVVRHIRVASGVTNVIVRDNLVDENATTEAIDNNNSIMQFANADATPSVASGHRMYKTAATGVSVTNLDDGCDGSPVTLIAGSTVGATLIADAGNFLLTAAWAPDSNGDNITLVLDNGKWTEITRADN